jgi:hypothetical protein
VARDIDHEMQWNDHLRGLVNRPTEQQRRRRMQLHPGATYLHGDNGQRHNARRDKARKPQSAPQRAGPIECARCRLARSRTRLLRDRPGKMPKVRNHLRSSSAAFDSARFPAARSSTRRGGQR